MTDSLAVNDASPAPAVPAQSGSGSSSLEHAGAPGGAWNEASGLRAEGEITFFELLNPLLRRWRWVLGVPAAAVFLTGIVSLVVPVTYTAVATFAPQVSSGASVAASQLSSLAGQFGISLPGDLTQLPQFYAQVLQSREAFDHVLLTKFANPDWRPGDPDSVTLLTLLEPDGEDLLDSLHNARKELVDLVSVDVDRETGIVQLSVDSHYPELAAAVANEFVRYLNEFNAQTRQFQARERRRFIEGRIADAGRSLHDAEEDLKSFYERNRTWQQSPQLVVEEDRLRRRVQLQQEIFVTLNREYELARIEEVNDTPVLTIVDRPVPPREKSKPRRWLWVLVAGFISTTVSVGAALLGEYHNRARTEARGDYEEFLRLLQGVASEVRGLWLRLRRRSQA
jgi:uncharacterized protein involved in exopolysaccharide biosynthesis